MIDMMREMIEIASMAGLLGEVSARAREGAVKNHPPDVQVPSRPAQALGAGLAASSSWARTASSAGVRLGAPSLSRSRKALISSGLPG